ncbi:ejaculatory bulb-specific protein 3-like [Anoplophora glabripennis]|uniref:ejaculatory bulb-specific protein 3-like n=1 Tax=Anoplophora glabripennis TaxID=217634 RepID=UPI0008748694|nr:ejaculatory bulb-specific protein 3-like [Anoplophora glabripennis]
MVSMAVDIVLQEKSTSVIMNSFAVIVICALFQSVYALGLEDHIPNFDNFNLNDIIKSRTVFDNYMNCFLDKDKCSKGGELLKGIVLDTIKTNCKTCTEAQRNIGKTIVRYLMDNKVDLWDEIKAKYVPR